MPIITSANGKTLLEKVFQEQQNDIAEKRVLENAQVQIPAELAKHIGSNFATTNGGTSGTKFKKFSIADQNARTFLTSSSRG
jgi:molybdopterin biosynthesis enzyme MoaB